MVEQAMILPVMVFLILGILQLTMIQHARICTEYAAFNAARSGIVYNGDPDKMQMAALISLLPTIGRVDNWDDLFEKFIKNIVVPRLAQDFAAAIGMDFVLGLAPVQVRIVDHPNPAIGNRLAILDQQTHLNRKQIDFDDWRTLPALANQLTIEVVYYYEMRIPFANWMLQYMWLAHHVGRGDIYDGGIGFATPESRFGGGSAHTRIKQAAVAFGGNELRMVLAYKEINQVRIPIHTWYTMRMQSNLYRENLGN